MHIRCKKAEKYPGTVYIYSIKNAGTRVDRVKKLPVEEIIFMLRAAPFIKNHLKTGIINL